MQSFSLINFSKEDWSAKRKARKQLLFEALLKCSNVKEVFYVDPPRHFFNSCSFITTPYERLKVWQSRRFLPGDRFSWVRAVNRTAIYCKLYKHLRDRYPWYSFLYNPFDVTLIKYLSKHGPVIYDWTEDWSDYYKNPKFDIYQKLAIKKASFVITVTKYLESCANELTDNKQKVLFLPNATGWRLDKNKPVSNEIDRISLPRIGYFGHVGPWFDKSLLIELSQVRPNWHWVLVGYVDPAISKELKSIKNIHLIGLKPYNELPGYAAKCQVLVAPYRKGISGDATKLYDYLTIGHPIISSEIETANRLQPYVYTANCIRSWIDTINYALKEKDISLQKARIRESLNHTWDNRASVLLKWLKSLKYE
jgi:hypothetical protein